MTAQYFSLSGKVAWITGASRGIGLALAQAYAAAGAHLVLSSRKQEGLDQAAAELADLGYDAWPIASHTGSSEALQVVVDQIVGRWGGIDILVNNAATNPHFGPIITAQESHWDKILDVNVKGYFRTVQACVPLMKKRGGGKIINMASVAGKQPQPLMGIYSVSKAAVIMLTEVLAAELAADNIQVNCIAPGFVKTSFSRALWQNEKIYDQIVKAIPQRRMADPPEIAGAALYLASSASDFTTGATFVIDGGQLVGSNIGS